LDVSFANDAISTGSLGMDEVRSTSPLSESHPNETPAREQVPQVLPYACSDGNELQYSFYVDDKGKVKRRIIAHSLHVGSDEPLATTMFVDCDGKEKSFSIAVAPSATVIEGSFAHFFADGTVMKLPNPRQLVRVCICPRHRQASIASALTDGLIATRPLAHLESDCVSWRIFIENGDGYVRFFDVERTSACFCQFPSLYFA
jgi:hypothetical protein